MLKNYFKTASRNMARNPYHVVINVLALGISLACCVITYLLFEYNIKFDSMHGNYPDIFRIHVTQKIENKIEEFASTPAPLGPLVEKEVAAISESNRYAPWWSTATKGNSSFSESVHFTDINFFKLFNFKFLQGAKENFRSKNDMVITESIAKKYWNEQSPIGQDLYLHFGEELVGFKIAGVVEDHPLNSSFQFRLLIPYENYEPLTNEHHKKNPWLRWEPSTFVKLTDPHNETSVEKQLQAYGALNNKLSQMRTIENVLLIPFEEMSRNNNVHESRTHLAMSSEPLILFIILSGLIFLMSCFNYTNTSIATARKRFKEIGIRKVLGGVRMQIVKQFMLENLAICLFAIVAGLLFTEILLPQFNNLWGSEFQLSYSNNVLLFSFLAVLLLMTAIAAGLYPSMYVSNFQPAHIFKGIGKERGPNFIIRILLTLQFTISIVGVVGGLIFYQNSKYQNDLEMGYNTKEILVVEIPGGEKGSYFRNRLSENPKVISHGLASQHIGFGNYDSPAKHGQEEVQALILGVGKNYLKTMGVNFIDGRDYYYQSPAEGVDQIVVNEKLVEMLKLKEPVGTIINIEHTDHEIIGVVKNFYHYGVFGPIKPMAFPLRMDDMGGTLAIQVDESALAETSVSIEKLYREVYPTRPYEGMKQDVVFEGARRTNENMVKIFLFLSILSTLLSLAGLFSLVSLNINKRMKEIGIRKVMGASIVHIITIINLDFLIILLMSFIIGSIAGYYLLDKMLDQFYTRHIEVRPSVFIISLSAFLFIALLTIWRRVYNAATANPVNSLRNE